MDNLANSKTKQAIDKLLHLLKGRAVSLEEMYTLCGCGMMLWLERSSLIEREGIRIGRIKPGGWLVDINEGPASPQSGDRLV